MKQESKISEDIYLCQVSERVSCGACCGLYNVADPSYSSLKKILSYRTYTFSYIPREPDAIAAFGEEISAKDSRNRPFPDFHHCPYIGLVGEKKLRVGCLLHPSAEGNEGRDFRGLSFYGGMACRMYFCPSSRGLSPVFKEIVRDSIDDWYVYGLVVTETAMLDAFFTQVENRINRHLKKADIFENDIALESLREVLTLKLRWPFRKARQGICNYFFEDQIYSKPRVNYKALGAEPSDYDILLHEMVSVFDSAEELHQAEKLLESLIGRLAFHIL